MVGEVNAINHKIADNIRPRDFQRTPADDRVDTHATYNRTVITNLNNLEFNPTTLRYTPKQSDGTIRAKAVGLAIAGPVLHTAMAVANFVGRVLRTITLYHFWSYQVEGGKFDAKEGFKKTGEDLTKAFAGLLAPIVMPGLAIATIISPKNGRDWYGAAEALVYGQNAPARSFAPIGSEALVEVPTHNKAKDAQYSDAAGLLHTRKGYDTTRKQVSIGFN